MLLSLLFCLDFETMSRAMRFVACIVAVGLLCGTATAGTPASYSQQFAYRMLYQSAAACTLVASPVGEDVPTSRMSRFCVCSSRL